MFVIYDEIHAESQGEFPSLEQAVEELRRRAEIPWDQPPNIAPCASWAKCGRKYEIIEYGDSQDHPWNELRRISVLELSAAGVEWAPEFSDSK